MLFLALVVALSLTALCLLGPTVLATLAFDRDRPARSAALVVGLGRSFGLTAWAAYTLLTSL